MVILYLRAASETDLLEKLAEAGLWDIAEDKFYPRIFGEAIDIIGTIYRSTGATTVIEEEIVDIVEAEQGFYANLLLLEDVPEELTSITMTPPINPIRVFA